MFRELRSLGSKIILKTRCKMALLKECATSRPPRAINIPLLRSEDHVPDQSTKYKAQSTKYKVQSTKYKAQSTKHKAPSTKHNLQSEILNLKSLERFVNRLTLLRKKLWTVLGNVQTIFQPDSKLTINHHCRLIAKAHARLYGCFVTTYKVCPLMAIHANTMSCPMW